MAENRVGAGQKFVSGAREKPLAENDKVRPHQSEQDDAIAGDTGGGEDDASTEINGNDSHLHEDQKSRTLET